MIKNYFLLLFSLFGSVLNLSAQQLSLTASKTSMAEGENAFITATLSAASANDIYIPFASKGTAFLGTDFSTNASTVITTTAGGNGAGSADNQLSYPRSVGFDEVGNMYVLENNCVSKWAVNATSGIKIVSGLYNVSGMFVDKAGNVYLGTENNYRIEKWAPGASSGQIVAGNYGYGSAANQLTNISNFYVDKSGNIYIADYTNHRIQRWTQGANSGVTVAGGNGYGSNSNQLNSPNSVFVDDNGNVFVCDSGNNRIQKWTPGATSGTTILSSTPENPLGNNIERLQLDAAGQIYLMTTVYGYSPFGKSITKWNPVSKKGIVITGNAVPGTAANQFDSPQGFYIDVNGSLYVADTNNHRIQKYNYNNLRIKAGEQTAQLDIWQTEDNVEEGIEQIILKFDAVPNLSITSASEFQIELTDNTNTPKPIWQQLNSAQNKYETIVLNATAEGNVSLDYKITKLPSSGSLYQTKDGLTLGSIITSVPSLVTNADHKVIYVPNWNINDPEVEEFAFSAHNQNISSEVDGKIILNITKVGYPTLNIVSSKNSLTEGENALLTATLSEAIQYDVYIPFVSKGTAVVGADFTTNAAKVISTVAGGNGSGSNANQLSTPRKVGVDGSGNIYVLDNNGVSKWTANGSSGTRIISNPYYAVGMFVDKAGNVYLGNSNTFSIEKWEPNASSGVVVAGGNGSGANANQLTTVTNFCVDKLGNVYVADINNYRVQKWSVGATKGVTVVGGNGNGSNANQIGSTISIFVDDSENIYVNDANNNRIQKWTAAATTGLTVLSNSAGSYYGNTYEGIQVDAAGKIYLLTNNNGYYPPTVNITQVEPLTKKITVVAGTSSGGSAADQLDMAQGYCLDANGKLYIADTNNHRIQKYNFSNLLIKAGEKSAQLAIGAAMDIYEEPTEQISLMIEAVPHMTLIGTSELQIDLTDNTNTPKPVGSEISTAQNKYETIVLNATAEGNVSLDYKITKLPLNGTLYQTPDGIALGAAISTVPTLVTNPDHKVVFVPNWTTVATSNDEFAFSAHNGTITSLVDGKVTLSITKVDYPAISLAASKTSMAEHEKVTITATLTAALPKDVYIPFESKGTAVFDTDFSTNAPTIISTVAGGNGNGAAANQFNWAQNIVVDAAGNIYICDTNNHRVQKWAPGATTGITVAGGNYSGTGLNQLNYPRGIFVDASGNIYISDTLNSRIVKWTPGSTAGIVVAGGNGSGSATNQLSYANAVFVDGAGNIYVSDNNNNRIVKWAAGATTATVVAGGNANGSAANQLNGPSGIFVDAASNLYIADGNNYRIQKWALGATAGTTVAGGNGVGSAANQFSYSINLFVDALGNLYIADSSNNRIQKWSPGATSGKTIAGNSIMGSGANQLASPSAVYLDATGALYICDAGNYRVQKYSSKSLLIAAGATSGQLVVSGTEDNLENEGKEVIELKFGSAPQTTLASADLISIDLLDNSRSLSLQTNSPFLGLENGAVSWGDYDKDGDQDVAVMGTGNTGVSTKVYTNDSGVFRDSNQNFVKLYNGDISWVDINKDGWIDLVVSGFNGTAPKTVVYLNNGKFFLESSTYNLPQLYSSKMAWGDLDNDGDADLLISGIDATEKYVFKMMVNDKNKTFIEDAEFSRLYQGFTDGAIKIADIDLDGDNDIVYSGKSVSGYPVQNVIYNSYIKTAITPNYSLNYLKNSTIEIAKINSSQNYLTYIINGVDNSGKLDCYSNNSMFASNIMMGGVSKFPKLKNGDIAIADFNNDGTNDIVFTGENADGKGETKLFLQDGNGIFTESPIVLEGMRNSTANWVDYDGDGDLDLFLTGYSSTGGIKSLLYMSEIANKKNTAPAKVSGLVMTDVGNGKIKLKWDVPADDYSSNLGYEIRIGTTPGGSELACVDSDPLTGARLISNPATVYTNFYETQLNPGKYYWSVQAVDTGLKGGLFSDESSFTITYDWKVLNQGGIIDRTINGNSAPIMKLADLDNDNDMDLIFNNNSLGYGYNVLKFNGKQLVAEGSSPIGTGTLTGVEVGDFNGDSKADVLVATGTTSSPGGITINLSNATGSSPFYLSDGLYKPKMRIADINNDGQAEILVMGVTTNTASGVPNLWIFNYDKSTAKFSKTDVSKQIEPLSNASFDLGDFDKDQDIDLIISGLNPLSGLKGIIYENITSLGGDFTIKATANNLVAVKNGTTDFVDFDADGDLDVVFTGESFEGNVFEIYMNKINEGISSWPKLSSKLTPIRNGKIDLGDFNGDGYSDLLYSGLTEGSGNITKLCEFVPSQLSFKDSDFDVSDIINAEVEFGDIDGDKDLDFIITGESKTNPGTYIFRTYVNYRNDSAKVLNQSLRSAAVAGNDKPTVPSLSAESVKRLTTVSSKDGTYPVEINWNAATDDNTPSTGLSYALKIGTTEGGEQIMAANANSDGTRKISGKGNVEHSTKWRLSLPPGKYYWSVQAIDASYAGSEYSQVNSFEIKAEGTLGNKSFEKAKELHISVSPNPAVNFVNVVAGEKLDIEKVEVYDYLGKLLITDKKNTISVQNLSKGVYIVKIYTSKGVVSKKMIKK